MRVAAISDMHGNAVAFEAVLKDLKQQSPDAVVCLGDIVMRGPQPAECVQMLRSLRPLAVVRGNFDDVFVRYPNGWEPKSYKTAHGLRSFHYTRPRLSAEEIEWLGNLPVTERLNLEGVQAELCHATPTARTGEIYPWASVEELSALWQEESTRLVLYGHLHHTFIRWARGRTIVNAGSAGLPFDGDSRPGYAVIDIQGDCISAQIRRVAYDVEQAIVVAREYGMPDLEDFEYALRHAAYPYDGSYRK